MGPFIAAFICTCGIAGLFYLDRDRTVRTSKALWLPTIYLWIIGSRPVSDWLSGGLAGGGDSVQSAGSPIDVAIFASARTVSRVALQFIQIINITIWPEFSKTMGCWPAK